MRSYATHAIKEICSRKTSAWRLPSEGASVDATNTTTINPGDNELSQMEKKLSDLQTKLDKA